MADHDRHVHLVSEKFQEISFYAELEKCGFHQSKVEFLGYIIFGDGVCMDPCKVQTIMNWAILASIRDAQCFLGFVNSYQRFIAHYSMTVTPFTCLTWKDRPFSWGVEAENAFSIFEGIFHNYPIFIHANLCNFFCFGDGCL
jgi:hypothetical protein